MSETTRYDPDTSLKLAQDFIDAVQSKDITQVEATLAPSARQLFMHSNRPRSAAGTKEIWSGRVERTVCVADLKGRSEVLAYTRGLMKKFTPLVWADHEWSVSPDGRRVFFRGRGNMVVEATGKPYRNNYVTVFDIKDGQILRVTEFGNTFTYVGLRIMPNAAELRSFLRATRHLFPFARP